MLTLKYKLTKNSNIFIPASIAQLIERLRSYRMDSGSNPAQNFCNFWEIWTSALRCLYTHVCHTEKYYSKNSYLGPEEMPLNKNSVGSTVFHANFIASVADTARIFYLK